MSDATVDEHGEPVHIEAVYYRHQGVYTYEAESIEEAVRFLANGEDYGDLSSVGVFVNGDPRLTDAYVTDGGRPPTEKEAATMRSAYAKAHAR